MTVEGGANEVSEEVMVEALTQAQAAIDKLCDLQLRLAAESEKAGRKVAKRVFTPIMPQEPVKKLVSDKAVPEVKKILHEHLPKWFLDHRLRELKDALKGMITEKAKTDPIFLGGEASVGSLVEEIVYRESREMCLTEKV